MPVVLAVLVAASPRPDVRSILRKAVKDASTWLGLPVPEDVDVRMVSSLPCRRRWMIGAAFPVEGKVLVDGSKLSVATENDLVVVLRHEAVHLVLHGLPRRLPRWFEEGAAEIFSGRSLAVRDAMLVSMAVSGRLIPFSSLEDDWPERAEDARLAYIQSASFLLFLQRKIGRDIVPRIVADVRGDMEFPEAFKKEIGCKVPCAVGEWSAYLGRRRRWLGFFRIFRTEVLFVIMGFLTVVAFLLYMYRRESRLRAMEEEEWM